MPATEGMTGYNTTVEVETTLNAGDWFELGEVRSVTPPNESTDQVDATHMKSPNRTKEYVQGMIEAGECSMPLNWIPGNGTDEYILDWRLAGVTRRLRITYPNTKYDIFPSFVLGYQPGEVTPDGLMTTTLNVKVAGAVTTNRT